MAIHVSAVARMPFFDAVAQINLQAMRIRQVPFFEIASTLNGLGIRQAAELTVASSTQA